MVITSTIRNQLTHVWGTSEQFYWMCWLGGILHSMSAFRFYAVQFGVGFCRSNNITISHHNNIDITRTQWHTHRRTCCTVTVCTLTTVYRGWTRKARPTALSELSISKCIYDRKKRFFFKIKCRISLHYYQFYFIFNACIFSHIAASNTIIDDCTY